MTLCRCKVFVKDVKAVLRRVSADMRDELMRACCRVSVQAPVRMGDVIVSKEDGYPEDLVASADGISIEK